jgi:hypothetical protein
MIFTGMGVPSTQRDLLASRQLAAITGSQNFGGCKKAVDGRDKKPSRMILESAMLVPSSPLSFLASKGKAPALGSISHRLTILISRKVANNPYEARPASGRRLIWVKP